MLCRRFHEFHGSVAWLNDAWHSIGTTTIRIVHADHKSSRESPFVLFERVSVDVEFMPAVEPGVEGGRFGWNLQRVFGEGPVAEAALAVAGAGGLDLEIVFGAVEGVAAEAE